MKESILFRVLPAALFLTILLAPQAALAKAINCPKEPKANVPIASGEVYAGTNCVLHTPGDVDSFVFSANGGDTYQIIVAFQGGYNGTCMALYDPNGNEIFPNPGNPNNCTGDGDLVVPQTLTVTGKYKINLTMENNGSGGDYALSLERINPFPPDAQPVTLAHAVKGTLAPANEQITYTFNGFTSGTYMVSANFTGGYNGTCVYLYYPGSATPQAPPDQGCTGDGVFQFTFNPPQNGTYMVLLTGENDGSGGDYSFEVSCYLGTCPIGTATKTALTSSPNPSESGQAVTFTATVTSKKGSPADGETVAFMKGKTTLGTGTLSAGVATFTTSGLPVGTSSITAAYSGDLYFKPSKSKPVSQVVEAAGGEE